MEAGEERRWRDRQIQAEETFMIQILTDREKGGRQKVRVDRQRPDCRKLLCSKWLLIGRQRPEDSMASELTQDAYYQPPSCIIANAMKSTSRNAFRRNRLRCMQRIIA